jgi:predicted regulator of amino acid metabolism with ACT domain
MALYSDPKFLQAKALLNELSAKYNLSYEEIFSQIHKIRIPVSLFSTDLSGFEIISKYLVENIGLKYSQIANLTKRNRQGVYQAYKHATRKHPAKFIPRYSEHDLPIQIFSSNYSILESVVKYLHDMGLSFSEIARLIKRDQRTVWTVNKRAKSK